MIALCNPSKDDPTEQQGRRKRVGKGNKGRWKGGRWSLDEYFQQATLCFKTLHHYI
jgi:hypothetical protein